MRVYIAGKWAERDRLRLERDKVRALGIEVESGWMDERDEQLNYPAVITNPNGEYTARDLGQIETSDLFIIDTKDISSGREFECGYAHCYGVPFWVVGPYRSLFHTLSSEHFDNWDQAREALIRC